MVDLSRCAAALFLTLLVAGCASDEPDPAPTDPPITGEALFERGGHAVGYRKTELTYDPVGEDDTRSLQLHVWYPAVDGGEDPADYRVGGIVSVDATGALAEPAVVEGGPFPLVVYSHGFGGEGLLAYPYAELFASHGWVVVAPNHTGNTALDGFTNMFDPFATITVNRPHDVTAVIDWMADSLDEDIPGLSARTGEVFLFGHSFGAYTTFASGGVDLDLDALVADCVDPDCDIYAQPEVEQAFEDFGDPRIAAIAPQAPALVGAYAEGELAALEVPTLLQSGRRDITTTSEEQAEPAWAGLDHPDDIWVEIPDGGHLSFLTICDDLDDELVKGFQPNADEDGCGADFTPVSQTVPALAAYLLGFARVHILDQDDWRPILTGEPLDPAVVVTAR